MCSSRTRAGLQQARAKEARAKEARTKGDHSTESTLAGCGSTATQQQNMDLQHNPNIHSGSIDGTTDIYNSVLISHFNEDKAPTAELKWAFWVNGQRMLVGVSVKAS